MSDGTSAAKGIRLGDVEISASVEAAARRLPIGHERYFAIEAGDVVIPLSSLTLSRARVEGIAAAVDKMMEAAQGARTRRSPVAVRARKEGGFLVMDGNSTTCVAAAAGWHDVPCRLVED